MFQQNNGYYQPAFQQGYYNPTNGMPDMLNGYKQQYQQQGQQIQPQIQPKPIASDMIWVQGEAGAKAYLVAPNNTVTLWDTESDTIYIKSADGSGVPSMKILDFRQRDAQPSNSLKNEPNSHKCTCGNKFATKEQFNELSMKLDELQAQYDELLQQNEKAKAKTVKKGD